ncbi:MAG: MFS transporter [Brevinema sp.]
MLYEKFGFTSKEQWRSFLTVVTSGQIIYSAFEAWKASFYTPLLEFLNISNAQFGILFTVIGSSLFFYAPAGWLNNRFTTRHLLVWGLTLRVIGTLFIILIPNLNFYVLCAVALSWGIVDSFFWPAVLNGTRLFSNPSNQGQAFGLLESIRRAMELGMNLVALALFSLLGADANAIRIVMALYTCFIALWILLVLKFVPNLQLLKSESNEEKNKEAFRGLLRAMTYPEVWLAGMIGMAVYTCYISVVYSVPYMQNVFNISSEQVALFGLFNASGIGIAGGLIAGILGDKVFKSPTRMLQYALFMIFIMLVIIIVTPKTPNMLFMNLIFMFTYSLFIFIARSVFFAPIGEANIPKEFSGSAMSIGSIFTYSPAFWAYGVNGYILDQNINTPEIGYQYIFSIGASFALIGCISAVILTRIIRKKQTV